MYTSQHQIDDLKFMFSIAWIWRKNPMIDWDYVDLYEMITYLKN